MRFNLQEGFPLLTTKKVNFKLIASELIWFIRGDPNIQYLLKNNNNIWNEWAFKRWLESDEYTGPALTDLGTRRLTDDPFAHDYQIEMKKCEESIIADEAIAKK